MPIPTCLSGIVDRACGPVNSFCELFQSFCALNPAKASDFLDTHSKTWPVKRDSSPCGWARCSVTEGTQAQTALVLNDPPEISQRSGQYVQVQVPCRDGPVFRAYSISSPSYKSDMVELVVRLVPGGIGSTYLHTLREGEPVDVHRILRGVSS